MRALPLAARAALLAAVSLPAALPLGLEAQNLYPEGSVVSGVTVRQYNYGDGFAIDYARQLAIPIALAAPVGQRLAVDIGTFYAVTTVRQGGDNSTFSNFTDTQVRAAYTFGADAVVASVMVNLPTGPETTTLQRFGVAASAASNFLLFPVNTYGTGFSVTPGLAAAVTAGDWNLGLAASVRWSSEYEPFSGGTSVKYQPGLETRIRAGVDRLVGRGRLALGATFSTFANDELSGSGLSGGTFDPGNRLLVDGEFTFPAGSGTMSAYSWNYYRSAASGGASESENVFTAGLSGRWALGATTSFEPLIEGRFWSPETGSGTLIGGGAAIRMQLSPKVSFAPSARLDLGSVETATSGGSKSVFGWELSALLRYGI
jgi:hypothetical protein